MRNENLAFSGYFPGENRIARFKRNGEGHHMEVIILDFFKTSASS